MRLACLTAMTPLGLERSPVYIKESGGPFANNGASTRLVFSRRFFMHVCDHSTPEALYFFDARGIAKRV